MANTYSDMGRFLQDAFSINDTFTSKRRLNESKHKFNEDLDSMWIIVPTERRYDDLTASDYLEFARKYGTFNNQQDCFDRMTELAPDRWDAFIPMKLEGISESLKEAYETDVDLPYDPDASYSVDIDTQSDPDAPYNANTDLPYDPDTPYNVNESLNEEFEISIRSRFTPQKLKVLVNKAINNSGFPIEDIDRIEWLPGKLFETKDVIYILLKDNTEIPIVLPENNIENSIITALHRVLKYDKKYAK